LSGWRRLKRIELLPYHKLGVEKNKYLVFSKNQKEYLTPDDITLNSIREQLHNAGFIVSN